MIESRVSHCETEAPRTAAQELPMRNSLSCFSTAGLRRAITSRKRRCARRRVMRRYGISRNGSGWLDPGSSAWISTSCEQQQQPALTLLGYISSCSDRRTKRMRSPAVFSDDLICARQRGTFSRPNLRYFGCEEIPEKLINPVAVVTARDAPVASSCLVSSIKTSQRPRLVRASMASVSRTMA